MVQTKWTANQSISRLWQAEQQAKIYSAWNSQVKRVIDAYKSTK